MLSRIITIRRRPEVVRQSVRHDPQRVSCYDRLARLLRTDLRRNQAADGMIQEMVARNPKLSMAHVYRWRYTDEFLNPPRRRRSERPAIRRCQRHSGSPGTGSG